MKEKLLRCIFFSTVLLFASTLNVFALDEIKRPVEEDWRIFKQAENEFENINYGASLTLFEKAKEIRRQECNWEKYTLETVMLKSAVKKADDSLEEIVAYLKSREYREVIAIIDNEFLIHGKEYFGNSFKKLYDEVVKKEFYPEADYYIGKIYRLEGETLLALQYYEKALSHKDVLNVKEQEYDILYDIANIYKLLEDYSKYETYLLKILEKDSRFLDKNVFVNSILKTIKQNKPETVAKLFNLYRNDNIFSIKACHDLTLLYELTGYSDKALECAAFGSLTSFTKIVNVLADRDIEFQYEDLKQVMTKCQKYPDVIEWGNKNGSWELFVLLAKESSAQGCLLFATELYKILSLSEPVEYWRIQAEKNIILAPQF